MSDLCTVLWDDKTETVPPQRHLVLVEDHQFLLLDGTPSEQVKVMGPLSFEEGMAFAEKLLRDGIVTESDMARALCVCMVLVGCTRPLLPADKPHRLMAVDPALRERRDAAKAEAQPSEAA